MAQNELTNFSITYFHHIHGCDIQLSNNNTTARKTKTEGSGLIFSSHPLKPYQKFIVKMRKITDKTKEIMSIGFIDKSPSERNIPTKAVRIISLKNNERIENKSIYFYYKPAGSIHFGVYGHQEKNCNFKVNAENSLWAFICLNIPSTVIDIINDESFNLSNAKLIPLTLHSEIGRNVKLINNKIYKYDDRIPVSYAFSTSPLQIGQCIIVKILTTKSTTNSLIIGLTSMDPSNLNRKTLPENTSAFLKKPEYLIIEDSSWSFSEYDRITLQVTMNSKIKIWRNDYTLMKEIHIDLSRKYWALFDISCLQSVEVFAYKPLIDSRIVYENCKFSAGETNDNNNETICIVCCENSIEAALYPCGHLCMCFQCANRQWQSDKHGNCPICREKIKDVLKIFKA